MKKILTTTILALFIMVVYGQGDISVSIEGLRNNKGKAYVMLQNSAEIFESKNQYYKVAMIDIDKGNSSCTFSTIPLGTYAITILHDQDNNQKLTTNFIGMPIEGFGFSNNAKGRMGKPSFQAASFKVESGNTSKQTIKLIYL